MLEADMSQTMRSSLAKIARTMVIIRDSSLAAFSIALMLIMEELSSRRRRMPERESGRFYT